MMKKLSVFVLGVLCVIACSEESPFEKRGEVKKRIEISFSGNMENIVSWAQFSIYSEDGMSFNYIHNEDTICIEDGLYKSVDEDFYYPLIVFEKQYKYNISVFHFAIKYLKRTSNPIEEDDLSIQIKAFENGKLSKEETRVMRAYEINERPDADEYIYRFVF